MNAKIIEGIKKWYTSPDLFDINIPYTIRNIKENIMKNMDKLVIKGFIKVNEYLKYNITEISIK